jgi:Arylsulfotransferase (ASST)
VVTTTAAALGGGTIFLTPASGQGQYGPMIIDGNGAVVWFRPLSQPGRVATNLQVQQYRGQPVLTWWEGTVTVGVGNGDCVIADTSYREIARIPVGADLHEFTLTPAGTALFFVYNQVAADLTSVGGPANGMLYDAVAREVDVASGATVFEWHSHTHVAVAESYQPYGSTPPTPAPTQSAATPSPSASTPSLPYDFFHANSIDVDTDGHLLISARHTSCVYKVHRRSGNVLWRLGGRASDFAIGTGARFSWQHDARRRSDGTISVFDNGAGTLSDEPRSRGLVLDVDTTRRRATLVREYPHPQSLLATSQGCMRELSGGDVFIGWGDARHFSEFAADGTFLFDGQLPDDNVSYRAFRFPWTGQPTDRPAVAAQDVSEGVAVYASWNGATEVASWQILAGDQAHDLRPIGSASKTGFETAVLLRHNPRFVAAVARDRSNAALGTSPTVGVQKAM